MAAAPSPLFTQRDLNCLSDPDRSTRKRALEKIHKELGTLAKKPADFTPEIAQISLEHLHKLLVKCMRDPTEKCRELSVMILAALFPLAQDPAPLIADAVTGIRERLGSQPQVEESEEVRLETLKFLEVLLAVSRTTASEHINEVVAILEMACLDKFPEAKRLSADMIVSLCKTDGKLLAEHTPSLVKALASSLAHQQQKIRLAGLRGIEALIPHAEAAVLTEALPLISRLNLDRSHQLREAVLRVVAGWLPVLPATATPKILPVLLHGAADELDQVQEASVVLMEQVGEAREAAGAGAAAPAGRDEEGELSEELQARARSLYPPAFKGRPNAGARGLVAECWETLAAGLVAELGDWSATTRLKAAATLLNTLVYAERHATRHAEQLLGAFSRACMDEDDGVANTVDKCVRLAGAFIPPELFVSVCQSTLGNSGTPAGAKKAWMAVLGTLLEGCGRAEVAPLLGNVCDIVADMELSLPEAEEFQIHILRVVLGCVGAAGPDCAPQRRRLFVALLRIQGMNRTLPALAERATRGIASLAQAVGEVDVAALYAAEAGAVLEQITASAQAWRRDSAELLLFDTLLREGSVALGPHFAACVPVFAMAADHQRDAHVRSTLLVLLDQVLQDPALAAPARARGEALLADVIVPVCVWRAGKVAAAMRKGGVACLRQLLRARLCDKEAVMQQLGKDFEPGPLEPVLKSLMDEDDPEVRFIACGAVQEVCAIVEGSLGNEQVRNLYIELLKRMDDSNDRIRIEAARAFELFMPSVPRGYDPGQFDFLSRGLLVHLDDQNAEVQAGVLPAVLAAAAVNPTQMAAICKEVASKHRSGALCDKVIERANQLKRAAAGADDLN